MALLLPAALVALAAGGLPRVLPRRQAISPGHASVLGISLGLVAAAAAAAAQAGGEPLWPDVSSLGAYVPIAATATSKLLMLIVSTVTLLVLLSTVDHATKGWTTRRGLFGLLLAIAGGLLGGAPESQTIGRWLVTAGLAGAVLVGAYVFVLRFDLSLTPVVMATMTGLTHIREGVEGAFPGVLAGSLIGVAVTACTAWWMFRLLRQARARSAGEIAHV